MAPAQKTSDRRIAENVAAAIRDGILEGRYALGQRLIESDLMKSFGIGRSTAREVLLKLGNDGLVIHVRNRGAVIRKLSRSDVVDLFQIRELLEGLAARRAAEEMGDVAKRARFEQVFEAVQAAARGNDSWSYEQANRTFHHTIWELSGSRQIVGLLNRAQLLLFSVQFRSGLGAATRDRSNADHVRIAEALRAGDPRGAERAMRRHIRNTGRFVLGAPEHSFAPEE